RLRPFPPPTDRTRSPSAIRSEQGDPISRLLKAESDDFTSPGSSFRSASLLGLTLLLGGGCRGAPESAKPPVLAAPGAFPHELAPHAKVSCLRCHPIVAPRAEPEPPGHSACAGCHVAVFDA